MAQGTAQRIQRLPRGRTPTTWTPDTCPTKRGQTPRHAVGRPKGSKDVLPRRAGKPLIEIPRNTIAGLFKHIAQHKPKLYLDAIERGIKAGGAKSYPFVALGAAYIDGKPIERIVVQADARLLFVASAGQLPAAAPDLGADDDDNT